MTKSTLSPLGGRCTLASAVTASLGTATACPSPTDWQRSEQAAYMQAGPGGYTAIFHDRSRTTPTSLSMDCWSRAVTAGMVQ